jgi:hypothetical protein
MPPAAKTIAWSRPTPAFDPRKGLLHNDHFQISYVTNDIDRAVAIFRDRYGVPRFRESDAETASGGWIKVRAAWVGNMAYELISGGGPGMELWAEPPGEPFVLRHHHFGFLIQDEPTWDALEAEIRRGGWVVRQRAESADLGRTTYVEAPELGHYLEFILPGPALIARFDDTPRG